MLFGKVIGQVIATRKTGNTEGHRLLVVRVLNSELADTPKTLVCVDTVNSRMEDVVLFCGSSSARQTALTKNVCTDSTIVGIVDTVSSGKTDRFRKE
jgi:microcompartment protein CcmK/EutM